MSEIIE